MQYVCAPYTFSLFLNVRFFESDALLLIDHFEDEAEDEGSDAEAGEHDERGRVVALRGVFDARVRLVEHLADEQREEPQADVLNPEDEGVGRADNLRIDKLRHTGPQ